MPLRQEEGQPHGAIIVLDDLTEELDLQERLRRAENLAAVGRMSAQVAHEVRNPLHSIGLEAEMAAEMAARLGSVPLKQSLHSILGSVDRLQKITENYLKLSRLSDGQKAWVDLGEVLESVLATYAPVCESQGVRVDWTREMNANLMIWADRDLIEQVLGNLFRNSIQALENLEMPHGPTISWTLGNTESGKVWLRIEDNGPGISPEVKGKLFTPFVTTRAQGTGLGLSFIKKVLEDHGGSIRNLDRPEGQGACFEMSLPLSIKSLHAGEGSEFLEGPGSEDFRGPGMLAEPKLEKIHHV
jgi:signal transduction histidine kinase